MAFWQIASGASAYLSMILSHPTHDFDNRTIVRLLQRRSPEQVSDQMKKAAAVAA